MTVFDLHLFIFYTAALNKVGNTSPVLASPRAFGPFVWPNTSVPTDMSSLLSECVYTYNVYGVTLCAATSTSTLST